MAAQSTYKAKTPAIITDIVLLEATGEFEYVTAPTNAVGEELLSLASVGNLKSFKSMAMKLAF